MGFIQKHFDLNFTKIARTIFCKKILFCFTEIGVGFKCFSKEYNRPCEIQHTCLVKIGFVYGHIDIF